MVWNADEKFLKVKSLETSSWSKQPIWANDRTHRRRWLLSSKDAFKSV